MTRPDGEAAARSPRRLVAAAGPEFPDLHDDWPLLRAALAALRRDAATAVWSDPDGRLDGVRPGPGERRVGQHPPRRRVPGLGRPRRATLGVPVVNSPAALRWNIDKRYLRDLEAAGVPVVPTLWVEPRHEAADADRAGSTSPTARSWSSPRSQAAGSGRRATCPTSTARPGVTSRELTASGRTAMVQPYQRAVDDAGEVGLIFLGGAFSHAMHKDPMIRRGTGPRRQPDREPGRDAGHVPRTPSSPWATPALAAAERLHGPATYARVDTVEDDDGRPLVLELELLDPALFFVTTPRGGAAGAPSWPASAA